MRIKTCKLTSADFAVVSEVFVGNTSGQVATPTNEWFNYVLQSDDVFCFLHYKEQEPIGFSQVDRDISIGYISLIIRESERGKGLFAEIFASITEHIDPKMKTIRAFINDANLVSKKAFESVGFVGGQQRDENGLLIYEFDLH